MKAIFTLPPRDVFDNSLFEDGYRYAVYNYYGNGPIPRAKRRRFKIALKLGKDTLGKNVIDMGTADGIFVPTLSKYYKSVVAIDYSVDFAKYCSSLVSSLKLPNAQVICNHDLTFEQIREKIGNDFSAMYLLETLEHVGSQPDMWGSKINFLKGCFTLLKPGAPIIISVPKMVGPIIVFKNLLQRSLGLKHDSLSLRQLFRSGFLYKTDDLEPLWGGGHVGFNHLKLEKYLSQHFKIVRRKYTMISAFYVLNNA